MKSILKVLLVLCLVCPTIRAQRGTIVIPAQDTVRVPAGVALCADTVKVYGTLHCDNYDCLCRPITVLCFGTCIPGGVPVELLRISARYAEGRVFLVWSTASEYNNAGFEIQRCTGRDWIVVGFVPGSGSTTERREYAFSDPLMTATLPVAVRYRLRQIDFDGASTLSPEAEVRISAGESAFLFPPYPNPAAHAMTVSINLPAEGSAELTVYGMHGARVMEILRGETYGSGYHAFRLSTAGLPNGAYVLRLSAGGKTLTRLLVIRK